MDARPVVLVTGAAKRVGRALALGLARAGWGVAVHHRQSAPEAASLLIELQALGVPCTAFAADLSLEPACKALVPQVVAAMGRLDAVVNSASLFEHDEAYSFSTDALQRHLATNTVAPVHLSTALHRHWMERAALPGPVNACVVNVLDQKLDQLNPDHFSYTLSKAALACATTMLAQSLAPIVRVCGVSPGLMLGSPDISEARLAELQASTPLGRGVSPIDLAQVVLTLLNTPSMTGAFITLDAGSSLWPSRRDFAFQSSP